MSLFVVNRYLGEEDDGSVSQESRSQALLAQLQQKAKDKQKQNFTQQQQKQQPQQSPAHKKRKSQAVRSSVSDADEQRPPVKEKRRKKAKVEEEKQVEEEEQVEEKEQGEEEEQVEASDALTGAGAEEKREAKESSPRPAPSEFTMLGGFESKPVQKVLRVLPQWLSEPDVIHRDIKGNLVATRDVTAVSEALLSKLAAQGIHHFFPVQAEVIPAILESAQSGLLIGRAGFQPRDICVSAPTGSGKTLAFVIPVVQVLMQRAVCEVRALAVLPTKELAQQVCRVFSAYCEGTTLRVQMLVGQKSFAAEQASLSEQRGGWRRSLADIVVATPGRLVDHLNKTPGFRLDHLHFLIIDEADRMMDGVQQRWLSQVLEAAHTATRCAEDTPLFARTQLAHITAAGLSPPQMPLQKLLFSATLTQNPEKLQQLGLQQPRLFSSAPSCQGPTPSLTTERYHFPQGLTEYYVPCTLSKKPLLLLHFILRLKISPILCFTNSKEAAHRLYLLVQLFGGVQAAEFSSRLSPAERKKTLKEFEQGKLQLLISTDAAARGIDIEGIKCVLNYDAPQFIRTYIHRIGRTARAGKAGLAFTFLLGVQEKRFLHMVEEAGSPGIQRHIVKPDNLKSMEERYQHTLRELAAAVKSEGAR